MNRRSRRLEVVRDDGPVCAGHYVVSNCSSDAASCEPRMMLLRSHALKMLRSVGNGRELPCAMRGIILRQPFPGVCENRPVLSDGQEEYGPGGFATCGVF